MNEEVRASRPDRLIHHSTYESVPAGWLGSSFSSRRVIFKKRSLNVTGMNISARLLVPAAKCLKMSRCAGITDDEIKRFDRIRRGLDWGYAVDPLAYIVCHYDKTRRRLHIFHELYKAEMSNRAAARLIRAENTLNQEIIADAPNRRALPRCMSMDCG